MLSLAARTWDTTPFPGSSEFDCVRSEVQIQFSLESTALIVIDPWADHPNEGLHRRGQPRLENLVRLIEVFRRNERPIFYDATGMPIDPRVLQGVGRFDHFLEWDEAGQTGFRLQEQLIANRIQTLFWGGFHANLCVMDKPCGIRHILPRDRSRLGFLVRDATAALESAYTLEGEHLLDAVCYELEYHPNGYTCTVDAIADAFPNK